MRVATFALLMLAACTQTVDGFLSRLEDYDASVAASRSDASDAGAFLWLAPQAVPAAPPFAGGLTVVSNYVDDEVHCWCSATSARCGRGAPRFDVDAGGFTRCTIEFDRHTCTVLCP